MALFVGKLKHSTTTGLTLHLSLGCPLGASTHAASCSFGQRRPRIGTAKQPSRKRGTPALIGPRGCEIRLTEAKDKVARLRFFLRPATGTKCIVDGGVWDRQTCRA